MSKSSRTCCACGFDVGPTRGVIFVDLEDVRQLEQGDGQGRLPHGIPFPDAVAAWSVAHVACLDGRHVYAIPLGDAEPRDLLRWTAHLMNKRWLRHTDWQDFIRAEAQGAHGG